MKKNSQEFREHLKNIGFKKGDKTLQHNQMLGKHHTKETRILFSEQKTGSGNPNWKGGLNKNTNGYVVVLQHGHPYSVNGYVLLHRLVMEEHIGRLLSRAEIVHHINGDITDNRVMNLEIVTRGKHNQIHKKSANPITNAERTRIWRTKRIEGLSFCKSCYSMTHTIHPQINGKLDTKIGKCGKCGAVKEKP